MNHKVSNTNFKIFLIYVAYLTAAPCTYIHYTSEVKIPHTLQWNWSHLFLFFPVMSCEWKGSLIYNCLWVASGDIDCITIDSVNYNPTFESRDTQKQRYELNSSLIPWYTLPVDSRIKHFQDNLSRSLWSISSCEISTQ